MNKWLKLNGVLSLLLCGQAIAFTPAQGPYIGILAELNTAPTTHFAFVNHEEAKSVGTIKYNPVGGGGGAVLGYRIYQFRIEGEALYNRISADTLTVGTCTLQSSTLRVPTGSCFNPVYSNWGFNGSTSVFYGLINGYYDFVMDSVEPTVIPYVGLGLGVAQVKTQANFVFNYNVNSYGRGVTKSTSAAQGIIGVSYLIDDLTWIAMDYRYLTTNKLDTFDNSRYAINSLNFMINFTFDRSTD